LQYYRGEGATNYGFHLSTVKSNAGNRDIPMLEEVKQALLAERRQQQSCHITAMEVDGVQDFVFVKRNGSLYNKADINHAIKNIVNAYNRQEQRQAQREGRTPELLRHISSHNLRHTFATRFCENETNMKVIQEIMGHTDIKTTMNIYAEATMERKQLAMACLEGKMVIA
jgi:integrase